MSSNILKVFVSPGCYGCQRAQELVGWVLGKKPQLAVQVVDLSVDSDADIHRVFAVPTYLFNGKILFLGNPSREELQNWLNDLDFEG